jgi:hypothetical protein
MPSASASPTLTETELAEREHVHPVTLRRWRRSGFGPPWYRCGPRAIRYRLAGVEEWEAAQTRGPIVPSAANASAEMPATPQT